MPSSRNTNSTPCGTVTAWRAPQAGGEPAAASAYGGSHATCAPSTASASTVAPVLLGEPPASPSRAVLRDARVECRSDATRTEPLAYRTVEPQQQHHRFPSSQGVAGGVERHSGGPVSGRAPMRSSSSFGSLTNTKRLGHCHGKGGGVHSLSVAAVDLDSAPSVSGSFPARASATSHARKHAAAEPSHASTSHINLHDELIASANDSVDAGGASAAASPTVGFGSRVSDRTAPWSSLPTLTQHPHPAQPGGSAARRAARSTPPSVSLLRHRIKLEQLKDEQRQQLRDIEPHVGPLGVPCSGGGLASGGAAVGVSGVATGWPITPTPTAQTISIGGGNGHGNGGTGSSLEPGVGSSKDPRRDAIGGFHTPTTYIVDNKGFSVGSGGGNHAGNNTHAPLAQLNGENAAAYARAQRYMRRATSARHGPPLAGGGYPTGAKFFDLNVSGETVGA